MWQLSVRVKHIVAVTTISIVACAGAAFLLQSIVSAETDGWPQDVSDLRPYQQLTSVDGSLYALCGSSDMPFVSRSFSRDGTVTSSTPAAQEDRTSVDFCQERGALDADGVLYGIRQVFNENAVSIASEAAIVAYDAGTERWRAHLVDSNPCGDRSEIDLQPERMVLGGNGLLYVISSSDYCRGSNYLSIIRTSTGEVLFTKNLGDYTQVDWLSAYDQGVVIFQKGETLRYFNAAGSETATVNVEPQADYQRYPRAATADGRVYFDIAEDRRRDEVCDRTQMSIRIAGYDQRGKVFSHDMPFCQAVGQLVVTHEYNVAYTATSPDVSEAAFVKVTGDGTVVEDTFLPTEEAPYGYFMRDYALTADTNGNILLSQPFRRSDDQRLGTQFTLSEGGSDTVIATTTTDLLDPERSLSVQAGAAGMAPGRLYVAAMQCGSIGSCSGGDPTFIHAVDMPGLGMDYPRGAVLGVEPVEPPKRLDYIALGDSFVSGEGDLEGGTYYLPGTDGENNPDEKCHLSTRSYPYLLAQRSGLTEEFFRSVACSGAVANDIVNVLDEGNIAYRGQFRQYEGFSREVLRSEKNNALNIFTPGRAAQIEFVQKYQPKVVTVGIGGNDIGFDQKLKACITSFITNVLQSCPPATTEGSARYRDGADIQSLYGRLKPLYAALHEESPNSKIYAVGYPNIMALGTVCDLNVHLDAAERVYAIETVTYINTVVQAAARDAGVGYVDIEDSLQGIELCSGRQADIGVNGLTPGNDLLLGTIGKESYHPNQRGQKAIAEAIDLTAAYCDDVQQTLCPSGNNEAPSIPAYFNDYKPDNYITTLYNHSLIDQALLLPDRITNLGATLYAPGSKLYLELRSEPVSLGEYTVGADGTVNAEFTIPASVPPGYHELHAIGTAPNGEPIDQYQIVLVGASEDDVDGDGITNASDSCPFVEPVGVDVDQDSLDDACDPFIDEPPLPTAPTVVLPAFASAAIQKNVEVSGMGQAGSTADISADDSNPDTAAVTATADVGADGYMKNVDVSSLDDGTLTVTVMLRNGRGDSPTTSANTVKDTSQPKTTAAPDSEANSSGWHSQAVTVVLSASDESSGVKNITYRTDGVQTTLETTTSGSEALITISAEGTTTIYYYATDKAGNIGAVQTLDLKIDTTKPTTSITQQNYAIIVGFLGGRLTGTTSKDVSGVVEVNVTLTNVTTRQVTILPATCTKGCDQPNMSASWQLRASSLLSGLYAVTASSTDAAGNESEPSEPRVVILANL